MYDQTLGFKSSEGCFIVVCGRGGGVSACYGTFGSSGILGFSEVINYLSRFCAEGFPFGHSFGLGVLGFLRSAFGRFGQGLKICLALA